MTVDFPQATCDLHDPSIDVGMCCRREAERRESGGALE
jgi:hypothetical protein